MKIETMSTRDLLDRMGSETTDAEAEAMMKILKDAGWEDTDEIADAIWSDYIAEAVEKSK